MTARERVILELETLPDLDLDYLRRLIVSLRSRPAAVPPPSFDPNVFGPIYKEFAVEDRELAEQGMEGYARGLDDEERG